VFTELLEGRAEQHIALYAELTLGPIDPHFTKLSPYLVTYVRSVVCISEVVRFRPRRSIGARALRIHAGGPVPSVLVQAGFIPNNVSLPSSCLADLAVNSLSADTRREGSYRLGPH
jgi:hypothetical protein